MTKYWIATAAALLLSGCISQPSAIKPAFVCTSGENMMQTMLWFGLSRPQGAAITAVEWQSFVDKDVTPHFKAGLSVLDANGQWLEQNGSLAKEKSKALLLIHGADEQSDKDIETLRVIYKQRFAQESVMRVDQPACVSF